MRDTLRKLNYMFTARNKWHALAVFFLMIVGSFLEVIGIGAVPAFVALIASPETLTQYPVAERIMAALGIENQAQLVLWGAGLLLGVFVVKNLYRVFLTAVKSKFTLNRKVELQRRLLRAYLYGPYPYHLGNNSSRLLHTLDTETGRILSGSYSPILTIIMETMVMGMTVALMIMVEPLISLAVMVLLAVVSVTYYQVLNPRVKRFAKLTQKHHRRQIKTIQQGLHGIKDAKVLGREGYFLDTFQTSAYIRAKEAHQLAIVKAMPRLFLETVVMAAMVIVSALMVGQGRPPVEIIPVLALLAVAAVRMIPSFNTFVGAFASLQNGKPALDAVYADLRTLERQLEAEKSRERMPLHEAIRFETVSYKYPKAKTQALHGLSVEIPRGASVAFVGSSGAGKTTAVDLVLGLLRPTEGRISVDGQDIGENLRGWQRQIGYIPQHIYLTDDTLRRNVAFGMRDKEISEAQVWEALDAAQLRELAEGLPEGLDTVIGERGVRFSGGQRQRIGIARALYHRPAVLVMDEATSALDNITERYIVEALERMRGERTMIVIAHRLSTVRNCDTLYMLKDGALVAEGSYDELLATSDEFRRMAGELDLEPAPLAEAAA